VIILAGREEETGTSGRRIWLVTIGEPLPLPGCKERLLRTGWLAQELDRRGHEVLWWTSTFDHTKKTFHFLSDARLSVGDRIELFLLHANGYRRNVGASRLWNHLRIARKFCDQARLEPPPDAILCSWPTVELCAAAVRYARERNVPVALDIRDLWPDLLRDAAPRPLRGVARALLMRSYRTASDALRQSDAIVGISEGYLEWALRLGGLKRRKLDVVLPLGYRRSSVDGDRVAAAGARLLEAGVDPKRFVCWFVGSFVRTVDLRTVVEAARLLLERRDIQFVLSGDGEMREAWEAAAKGLPNVIWTGWVDEAGIAWLMSSAGAGLAAYGKGAPQGLPNKVFEYLSGGIPVLSSLGSEATALLADGECGLSYEAGNPIALVEAVCKLADGPDLRNTMADNARRLYEDRFDADQVYGRMADFLESLAGGREPSARRELERPLLSRSD
jgi:glycosyltransferase involved in cell wall biosynthesis